MAKIKGNLVPVYARITVNGKLAEINIKRDILVAYWYCNTKRVKSRTPGAKILNSYLGNLHANFLDCQKQLTAEFNLVAAQNMGQIKNMGRNLRFVKKD